MYYFIVNPNSRSGKGALISKELRRTLRQKHISYKAVFTGYRGHAVKLAASAAVAPIIFLMRPRPCESMSRKPKTALTTRESSISSAICC